MKESRPDLSELVDIRDVVIDRTLPVEERIKSYVQQIKNPYCFKVGDVKVKLYEKYRSGSISRERFIEQKAICSEQKKNAAQQLEKLNKEIESELRKRSERLQQADTIRDSIKVLECSDDEMRTHMYDAIDMVVVYADSEIEIRWKFSCDFEKTEENK